MVEYGVSSEFSQGDSDAGALAAETLCDLSAEMPTESADRQIFEWEGSSDTPDQSAADSNGNEDRVEDEDLRIPWMDSGLPVGPPAGALRADRRRTVLAWTYAILFHVLFVTAIIVYHDRFAGLRIRLARGTGSVSGPPNASDADALPGPILPAPDISSVEMEASYPPLSEAAAQPQPEFTTAPPPLLLPVPEPPAEPPSLGVGPSPDTPLPHFASHPLPAGKVAAASPVSPRPATGPAGPATAVVAVAGRPSGQVFKPPRPAGGGGGVLGDPDGVDERGLPIPEYPPQSRRRHEEGLVEVNVQVLPDGTVGAVRVITDPGFPRLVDSAVAAAKKARFEPALRDGQPVIASLIVPYRFILR